MNIVNNTLFPVETMPFKGPDGKTFLTVIVKGTYTITDQGQAVTAGEQLPVEFGDVPFDQENAGSNKFEADVAPFKPRTDIVLVGHAYAPAGRLVTAIDVSLRVGRLQKVLRVFGDRKWIDVGSPTDPQPFDKMPIVYERAYGGIDMTGGGYLPSNLAGCGYFAKIDKKSVEGSPLPNIEDPGYLIRSPKDQPRPMGFGFYGRAWEPRSRYLGTYDEEYREKYSPNPPPDFKFEYYNGAHPDLQMDGYLMGNEFVELINLTPRGTMAFQLPAQQITCHVEKNSEKLEAYIKTLDEQKIPRARLENTASGIEHIPMNLDTLCLLPDEAQCFILWRGRTQVYDHSALEVETVTIG